MSDDILRKAVLQQGIIYWSANWKTSLYGMFAACESLFWNSCDSADSHPPEEPHFMKPQLRLSK